MATILDGDIQVDYLADNRQKMMSWLGGTKLSYTMNELYSAMATLLDETATIDSGTAFSAETPVEYTTGKIDTGDTEPWYITFDLMEKITGGALRTTGWLRAEGTNTGIVVVPIDADGAIVAADAGKDIVTDTDGDAGTLLEVIDSTAASFLVIRPDTSAIGNSFNDAPNAGDTMTCNGHQSTQSGPATSGDQIWANLYSIGTIDSNVHLYLYQGEVAVDADRNRIYSWNDSSQDWYSNGHIDICVPLKDITAATWTVIDDGYVTVLARKYGDLYANFEAENSTTSGGRNPVPMQSSADLDNTTGTKQELVGSMTNDPFTIGEIITGGTSEARGILTSQVQDTSLNYIPIDDPQLDFIDGETITGATSTAFATSSGTPSDQGPALNTWFTSNNIPTATFAHINYDVDDNGADENYGITIDCKNNPLTEVYEWLKYATRNGEIINDLNGINGERYIGGEVYLAWSGAVGGGTISEGDDVTQTTSEATGIVVAFDDDDDVMLLRDVRGTFDTASAVTSTEGSGAITPTIAATFAPKTASPFGTFAGGTFFGARGVLIDNWLTADENKFILTPTEGGTKARPQAFILEVTNLVGGAETSALHDRVSAFRLDVAGGNIKKDEYDCAGGESAGDPTIVVDSSITQDTPGKTGGGSLVLVDAPAGTGLEYTIRYASWDDVTFTLANMAAFTSTGSTSATVVEYGSGGFNAAVKRGDLVYNHDLAAVGYVKQVVSDTQLSLEGDGIIGQDSTDAVEINCVPISVVSDDDVYVPFINKIATAAEESVSVIFVGQIYFRVRVRNTRATEKITPYSSDGQVATATSNQSIPTIRSEDTIIS